MSNQLVSQGINLAWHSFRRTISVICVIGFFGFIGFGVYRLIHPRPTESYAQQADAITNYETHNYYDSDGGFFFGIKVLGVKFGISKVKTYTVKSEKK